MAADKTLTPQQRRDRARRAALARNEPESAVRILERRANDLTPEHVDRLRAVLGLGPR